MKRARRSIALLLVVLIMASVCMVGLADGTSIPLSDLEISGYDQMVNSAMQVMAANGENEVWGRGYTNTENVVVYSMYAGSEDQYAIDTIPYKDTEVIVYVIPDDGIFSDGWYKIKYNDTIGYVEADKISFIPAVEYTHIEGCGADCTVEDCACPCHMLMLYEKLMACETIEEMEALIINMTEADGEAFLAALTPEQVEAFRAKVLELIPQNDYTLQTVPFTKAGPFMPAVFVGRGRMAKAMVRGDDDNDGVVTSKEVTNNGDGTYTLRLESYVTGETTTTIVTTTTPVDIVLVLDQSGSMSDSFGNTTRQAAMKTAVNNFIDAVAGKYDATDSDHRMAIVTYGSSASNLRGWTNVDAGGANNLHSAINGLPDEPEGATNAGAGMENAATLMGNGYDYSGPNTTRHKVVIMFTDGVPTTSSRFNVSVANTALGHANTLKNSLVTVYTIGIFTGANKDQLYGAMGFGENSDGTVGSHWSSYEGIFAGDVEKTDVPAGNRFLNYLSSNFISVTNIGLKEYKDKFLFWGQAGWEITANANRSTTDYYLTAEGHGGLNRIFEEISEQIETGGASVELHTDTVVKDVLTQYFTIPDGADKITVKTANCTGFDGETPVFSTTEDIADEVTVNVAPAANGNGDTVTVTGFDFSENWVGKDTTTGEVHHPGKKLIIEIIICPAPGFLGGDGVPTNTNESGIYPEGETEPIEKYDEPHTNVPQTPVVTPPDANVYLGAFFNETVTIDDIKAATDIKINGETVDLTNEDNYGLSEWQREYVQSISINIVPEDGKTFEDIQEDIDYYASIAITSTSGDTYTTTQQVGTVHVFLPKLTFADSEVWYGDDAPINFNANLVNATWVGTGDRDHEDPGVEMLANMDPPTLTYLYDSGIIGGKINTKQDIPVKVDVTMPMGLVDTNINQFTIFKHVPCPHEGCRWADTATPEEEPVMMNVLNAQNELDGDSNPAFLLHVNTCSLTIKKDGGASGEPYVFTVKKNGAAYTEASVGANGSVTISELPVGNYTITEDTGWSWRYGGSPYSANVTLDGDNPNDALTCTNSDPEQKWLNGYSAVEKNIYGESTVTGN